VSDRPNPPEGTDPDTSPARPWRWIQGVATRRIEALFVVAILIGTCAALINEGLHWLLDTTRNLRLLSAGVGPPLGTILVVLLPVVGILLLRRLERLFPGEISGYGLPHFLELVNVQGAAIRTRWIALKSLASSLTIGLGLSAGLEGPLVQIGGALGSSLGRPLRQSTGRLRVLIACGAAAMIATTFDAPLASVLFAQEIVLVGSFELATFSLVVVSAGTAVAVSRLVFPSHTLLAIPATSFPLGPELLLHVVIGALVGLVAVVYSQMIFRARRSLAGWSGRWSWPVALLIGLAIGVAGVTVPGIAGDGLATTGQVLAGRVPLLILVAVIGLKILATAGTLSVGGSGGIFAPAVLIGSATGYGAAAGLQHLVPGLVTNPADFGLVGICAMLGAVTHAPLTSAFLLFELAGPEVVLQGLLGVAAALMAARAFNPDTIEEMELLRHGVDLHAGLVERILSGMQVKNLMRHEVQTVPPGMPVLDFAHYAATTYHKYFPVMQGGVLLGVLTLDSLGPILDEPEAWRHLVLADLIGSGPIIHLRPEDDLALAERLFQAHGFEQIPVLETRKAEEGGGLEAVGLLHHQDVQRAAARRKLAMQLPH
jgi:CIC family chloride channel protein